jgi:enamine deaminase RidA (YjgF/YER057c/UK114 family)
VSIESRLKELGIELPEMAAPKGSYIPVQKAGHLLFLSGQLPTKNNALIYTGHVGSEVSLEEASQAAKLCMINSLAALKASLGDLERVKKIVKLQSFVNSAPDFTQQHVVTNGASDFLQEVFGDKGRHARTAVAVPELPLGSPIEIEMIVEID